jgi:hypothetical protein
VKVADKQPVSTHAMLSSAAIPAQWPTVRGHLEGASATYWLATVHPDGRPHVRPILAVWEGDGLYFCAGERTRKAKNLASSRVAPSPSNENLLITWSRASLRRFATQAGSSAWPTPTRRRTTGMSPCVPARSTTPRGLRRQVPLPMRSTW